ncbi:MAG: hypothetical protein P9L92_07810, partial [Candidatus Electryonea clarkiae]|nr:hypothetical protein [Candidatus Electryonea clarkiae]
MSMLTHRDSLFYHLSSTGRDYLRMLQSILLLSSLLLLFPFLLIAQTEVEGDVYGVWDVEGSPYIVVDTVTVPEDSTLIIEPGVTVSFPDQDEDQFPFIVLGNLEAVGEEGDSIYFLSEDSTFPGFEVITELGDQTIRFEYCVVDSVEELIRTFFGEEFT